MGAASGLHFANLDVLPMAIFMESYRLTPHPLLRSQEPGGREAFTQCASLGFSFGIYLKHLCDKLPPISKGLIVVTARGHGAGRDPFAGWLLSLELQGPQLSTLSTCFSSLYFSPTAMSVLPGLQSPVPLHPLSQLRRYQMAESCSRPNGNPHRSLGHRICVPVP